MEFSRVFHLTAKIEVTYVSGILRVIVTHQVNFFRLCLDVLGFLWFAWAETNSWNRSTAISKSINALVFVSAAADLAYQMTGSETLEFSPDGLKVGKKLLGWDWVRNYPIDKCSELSWRPDDKHEGECILECKAGWRKIRFGKYLNQQQAWEVLAELQRYLPEVAQKMGMSPDDRKSRITRLGLS